MSIDPDSNMASRRVLDVVWVGAKCPERWDIIENELLGGKWVVLFDDGFVETIDKDNNRMRKKIDGDFDYIRRSQPIDYGQEDRYELVYFERKCEYSRDMPLKLISENSDQNRLVVVLDISIMEWVYNVKLRVENAMVDQLFCKPYRATHITPYCDTIIREVALMDMMCFPTYIVLRNQRDLTQVPQITVRAVETLTKNIAAFSQAEDFNNYVQRVNKPGVLLERSRIYDPQLPEKNIFMSKMCVQDGRLAIQYRNVDSGLSRLDTQCCKIGNWTGIDHVLMNRKLETKPIADSMITDSLLHYERVPGTRNDHTPACIFIGTNTGMILAAGLKDGTLFQRLEPDFWVLHNSVFNVTFDGLQFNEMHDMLTAIGTDAQGKKRLYFFNVNKFLSRMEMLFVLEYRLFSNAVDTNEIPKIARTIKNCRQMMTTDPVFPISIINLEDDFRLCCLNESASFLNVATTTGYCSLRYLKGSLLGCQTETIMAATKKQKSGLFTDLNPDTIFLILKFLDSSTYWEDRWSKYELTSVTKHF